MKDKTKKIKIIVYILFGIVIIGFFSMITVLFLPGEDTTQLAKDEFSKYYNGKNEVVLVQAFDVYFESYEVKNVMAEFNSIIFCDEIIYYINADSDSRSMDINFYSCDYYFEKNKKIYSKKIYLDNFIGVKKDKNSFYIAYKKDKLTHIDKYTISTGIYENIVIGKDLDVSYYLPKKEQSKYNVEVIENISPNEHGKFIITDTETGIKKIIDDEYLKNTIYIESMEMFGYGPSRAVISNGHILLSYEISARYGGSYSHLIFEYDFESNQLEYKLLAFTVDAYSLEITYIG